MDGADAQRGKKIRYAVVGLGHLDELTINGKKTKKSVPNRDQFATEFLYFSDCTLKDRSPEPSGEDGMQDVRTVEALYKSARTGRTVRIPFFRDNQKPDSKETIRRPGIEKPKLVKVASVPSWK